MAKILGIVALVLALGAGAAAFAWGVLRAHVAYSSASIGPSKAVFNGLRVTATGPDPVLEADHLEVTYNLRDLAVGSHRAFGLSGIRATRPRVTLVRYADGTWNAPIQQKGQRGPTLSVGPFVFDARINDGSIDVRDETKPRTAVRELRVAGIQIAAHIDQHARSTYRVDAALMDGGREYPIAGRGFLDDRIGYEDNHWSSRAIPLVPLAGFLLSVPQASVAGGSLDDVDAHYFGLPARDGTIARHLTAHGYLNSLRVYIRTVHASLRDVHGDVYAYDDGAVAPHVEASLAGIPIAIAGGVYGLTAPQVRFGVRAHGSLSQAARIATIIAGKHVAGDIALTALAEGPVANPLILAAVSSKAIAYESFPVDDLDALVAIEGNDADVVRAAARYRDVRVDLRGTTMLTGSRPSLEGVARARGPVDTVPYAATILGPMNLDAVAVASGSADAFAAGGVVEGTGPDATLAGTVRFAPSGNGSIGPVLLERRDGSSLYARVAVDRKAGESVAIVDADRFPIASHGLAATVSADAGADIRGSRIASLGTFSARGTAARGTLVALGNFSSATGLRDLRAQGGAALTDALYRGRRADATTALRFGGGHLTIADGTATYGGAVALLDGSVAPGPRYDVHVHLTGAPIALAASLVGRTLPYPEGGIDADVRARGSGTSPELAGTVTIPEGSINGLPFTNAGVDLGGTPRALAARNGRVTVGSTTIAFDARSSGNGATGSVLAPRADLADFNEFFDVADTLAGKGSIATSFALGPSAAATSGTVALRGVRIRRFDVGDASARWSTQGRTVSANAAVSGINGRLRVQGTVGLPPTDPVRDLIRRSDLNVAATAQGIDLRQYLPLFGLQAPVTGTLDAGATVQGRYPALRVAAHADVTNGTIARLSLERATASVSAANGRARIDSAQVVAPHLTITADGETGLRPADPLALSARIVSDDVGALYNQASGKKLDLAGTLDSTLRVGGTLDAPQVSDTLSLDRLRYADLTIRHAGAQVIVTRTSGELRAGEVDFARGKLLASGLFPLAQSGGPIRVALTAAQIDVGSFGALFPKGTKLGGILDGSVTIAGATEDPLMDGRLTLDGGAFSSPSFQAGLSDAGATVAFAGNRIVVPDASAKIGGGTITATGNVTVPSLRTAARNATFRFVARADNAGFDLPAYFRGKVTADVTAARAAGAPIELGGDIAIEHARIPVNALYNPSSAPSSKPLDLPVAFNGLSIRVGQDVRVQSSVVDVGATGSMLVGGTLASPQLTGVFNSTGGTIDVYHEFRVQRGRISFSPAQGLMPTVNAVATTSVDNPPTDITLRVTGTVPNLDLALHSDPEYSRAQILGLLLGVQALGALQGLSQTGGATQAFNATSLAENAAESALRTQLTRGLFEPLQASLGNALGLNNLQLYLNDSGGFEAHATKGIGKHIDAIFGQTFGAVSRQVLGLRATPTRDLALQATYYQTQGATGFVQYNPSFLEALSTGTLNQTLIATTPSTGTNGYTFSVQRRYP
jgi:autotransporter translocation and assembly factor TamB